MRRAFSRSSTARSSSCSATRTRRCIKVFAHDPDVHADLERTLHSPSLYDEFLRYLARRGYAIPAECLERDWSQPYSAMMLWSQSSARSTPTRASTGRPMRCARSWSTSRSTFSSGASAISRPSSASSASAPAPAARRASGFLRQALDLTFFPELLTSRTEAPPGNEPRRSHRCSRRWPAHRGALRAHIFPLFSHTLARPGIYLANHSLGRPLNQTQDDVREVHRALAVATRRCVGLGGWPSSTRIARGSRNSSARRAPTASSRRPPPARACGLSSTRCPESAGALDRLRVRFRRRDPQAVRRRRAH